MSSSSTTTTIANANANTDKPSKPNVEIINGFQVPKWAGKPPSGLHLDVMKEGKMIQKLMIDEKKCYFFGRNKDTCDFVIDHASCSRVHSVLLWHKDLNRSFIIDLNSTHGTYIGSLKLDPNKPQQVFVDSELKFGASTRTYIVRERPQLNKHAVNPSSILNSSSSSIVDSLNETDKEDPSGFALLANLPESETELDVNNTIKIKEDFELNLTEFNTAHNKRIAQLVDISAASTGPNPVAALVKQKRKGVVFNDEEQIINPEDVDPTIGRFRNLVQTTVFIPNKKKKTTHNEFGLQNPNDQKVNPLAYDISTGLRQPQQSSRLNLYDDDNEDIETEETEEFEPSRFTLSNSLGVRILDLAPDVDNESFDHENQQHDKSNIAKKQQQHDQVYQQQMHEFEQQHYNQSQGDKKKKYAKEHWPGRHPNTQPSNVGAITSTNVGSLLSTKISPPPSLPISHIYEPIHSSDKSSSIKNSNNTSSSSSGNSFPSKRLAI